MGYSDELLKNLLETFRIEAEDILQELSSLLIGLERETGANERKRLIETLYRKMHTLKGAAQAVNLPEVGDICQAQESLLSGLKRGDIPPGAGLFDQLHAAINSLDRLIFPDKGTKAEVAEEPKPDTAPPSAAAGRQEPVDPRPAAPEKTPAVETVRIPVPVLDALLIQAEELISAKLMAAELLDELSRIGAELPARKGDRLRAMTLAQAARRRSGECREAGKLAELVEAQGNFERNLEQRLKALEKSAGQNLRTLGGMVDTLLDDMKKVHLLPFSSVFGQFPKIVRDIARDLGKDAELTWSGGELEVDRRILGELKDPLLHIVRNIVDHGIEAPDERRRQGKPPTGNITISVRHQDGNRAELVIADDGRGIDIGRVKAAAIGLELITPEQAEYLPDHEALQFIFESGVSTSPIVSTLSGRGLGLAIVREALERLGGHAMVTSEPGKGTGFRLILPLSFATIRGLLVETGGRVCLIPAVNVELTTRVAQADIKTVENRETIVIDSQTVALARLGEILELPGNESLPDQLPVVILTAAEKRIAFVVDQILDVREVLAKPLGSQLSRVRNVAGATVLGNGRVTPILNVNDLLRSAVKVSAGGGITMASAVKAAVRQVSVLVAEDSITSRTLLKNILESSGFRVKTAIDGADALTILKTEEFDVVVSDVEMPRMDGFELTAAIRRDNRLGGLPVILVTGLESREDRERGIDVGANAYLIKSSFDQSRLVEVIRKLTL